jgi:hypothetical protein
MARLPNCEKAFIDPTKIRDYILSFEHPIGRFKAALSQNMGYTHENWEQFVSDIKKYHLPMEAEPIGKTKYGQKYKMTGIIQGPNGKIMMFRSIWIILNGEDTPRFITIYPEGVRHEI